MNDKEIVKALECCCIEGYCKACPFHNASETDCGECIRLLQIHSHNLILRLKKMVADLKTVKNDDDEILRLLVNQSVKFIPKNDDIKAIQRDAVINFAERLKENLQNVAKEEIMGREYYLIGLSFVDNLVNKMFPEQKGEENGHREN